ncbi:2-methylcitrate dehydratase PrpD [Rhodoligotrophos appendicifer]|uniref:MmgE/PrpD family protein n=1 Tax=Rhodoligotrophos appendicifer TaxID=987056 RepID=UPI0014786E22|nr:MmgE/PrpD family protein [Rhodoligotrophos appendicifer]
MDHSQSLARELMELRFEALSEADVDQVKRLMLDYFGVAYGGVNLPWAVNLRKWADRFAGTGQAGLLGSPIRVAPHVAGLVNGATAHGYELDDTHDASTSHPGGVVITAAMAVAEDRGASGPAVMAAITAGYEAMARIGMAANAPEGMEFGHHPTAILGGFGAATAAAKLMGLDTSQLLTAWGHMLSLTGGSMQFSDEPAGTMVKRCHAGFGAQNGILAAELAEAGISAPQRAIDGKYGFLALYGKHPKPERLAGSGGAWEIHKISLKPYSCCRLFHSLIDGLGEVTDNYTTDLGQIAKIHVRGPKAIPDQHMLRRPSSVMAAQYSLPFVVGATLAFGPRRYDAYREENLSAASILGLADLVEASADAEIEAHYPEHFGTGVDLTLKDGRTRSATVLDSIGTPARPMSRPDIKAKGQGLIAPVDRDFDMDRLEAGIWALGGADSVSALSGLVMRRPHAA